jgi:hypothetical protein
VVATETTRFLMLTIVVLTGIIAAVITGVLSYLTGTSPSSSAAMAAGAFATSTGVMIAVMSFADT